MFPQQRCQYVWPYDIELQDNQQIINQEMVMT